MEDKMILLVEDNPDDEALTLRALKKNDIRSEVIVVRADDLTPVGHFSAPLKEVTLSSQGFVTGYLDNYIYILCLQGISCRDAEIR